MVDFFRAGARLTPLHHRLAFLSAEAIALRHVGKS